MSLKKNFGAHYFDDLQSGIGNVEKKADVYPYWRVFRQGHSTKEVKPVNEFNKVPSLGTLERSDNWGFGDSFQLLCNYTNILANAFHSGKSGFIKIDTALRDVWTTIEDSISDGKIRVKSGRLVDLSEGLLLTENLNIVVIDKKSFLSWYRRDKQKIVQYLSYAGLEIHQEGFLDRLAKMELLKTPHSKTNRAKRDRLREDYISSATKKFKDNPDLRFPDLNNDYRLQKLIRESGLPEDKHPKDSTLQGWIREARKKAKVKAKQGKPVKK